MMNMNTMTNLIKAERTAERMAEQLQKSGVQSDEYLLYYGTIVDALYELSGEHTKTIEESQVWQLLHSNLSDTLCAGLLMEMMKKKGLKEE